jgi:hypothetical protein
VLLVPYKVKGGEMKLTNTDLSLIALRNRDRSGRDCDPQEVIAQMGRMNFFAVCGGKWAKINASDGVTIGLLMPCGESRAVEVVLNFLDLYEVRRVRLVNRGEAKGTLVVEHEVLDVYCENLGDAVYSASCWK